MRPSRRPRCCAIDRRRRTVRPLSYQYGGTATAVSGQVDGPPILGSTLPAAGSRLPDLGDAACYSRASHSSNCIAVASTSPSFQALETAPIGEVDRGLQGDRGAVSPEVDVHPWDACHSGSRCWLRRLATMRRSLLGGISGQAGTRFQDPVSGGNWSPMLVWRLRKRFVVMGQPGARNGTKSYCHGLDVRPCQLFTGGLPGGSTYIQSNLRAACSVTVACSEIPYGAGSAATWSPRLVCRAG